MDRLGLEVAVTTLETAIADLFDRHVLAGGVDELFNSLDLVVSVSFILPSCAARVPTKLSFRFGICLSV